MFAAIALNAAVGIFVIVRGHLATPLVPIVASLLPVLARSRENVRLLRVVACVMMFAFAMLGLASIGALFLPGALGMCFAAAHT